VSTTVTLGWQLAVCPAGSVAVQLPAEVPTAKNPVVQLLVQLQLSVQEAAGVTVAPPLPVHCAVAAGHVIAGFALSTTWTYDVQVAVVEESNAVATTWMA